jgi:hypothetical protein
MDKRRWGRQRGDRVHRDNDIEGAVERNGRTPVGAPDEDGEEAGRRRGVNEEVGGVDVVDAAQDDVDQTRTKQQPKKRSRMTRLGRAPQFRTLRFRPGSLVQAVSHLLP